MTLPADQELVCLCGKKYIGWVSTITKIHHPSLCENCSRDAEFGICTDMWLRRGVIDEETCLEMKSKLDSGLPMKEVLTHAA